MFESMKQFFLTIDLRYREGFRQELVTQNKRRLLYTSGVLFVLAPLLFYFDYSLRVNQICDKINSYCTTLLILHEIIIGTGLIYFVSYFLFLRDAKYLVSKVFCNTTIVIYLISCVSISISDQMWTGTITVFLLVLFSIATMFLLTRSEALPMLGLSFVLFIIGMLLFQKDPSLRAANILNGTVVFLLATTVFLTFYHFRSNDYIQKLQIQEKNEELSLANEKIQELLRNVLPESIIAEINESGFSKPTSRDHATIVFTDFVSFSKSAEYIDPILLVQTLNEIYHEYDDIMKKYNLEKLKTIGDSYMYAGGLFSQDSQLENACLAAFEMLDYLSQKRFELLQKTNYDWAMRVGIHVGPTITGVIGKWRFLFDTWGNTVNLASRLEANSEPNQINVTDEVVRRLKDLKSPFVYEYRGEYTIKNMGTVPMYFLQKKNVQRE